MDKFDKQLRDGIKLDGFSVYLSIRKDELCFEVTDGDYDRSWLLDIEGTAKLLGAVGGIDELLSIFPQPESEWRNTDKFISAFEGVCEKHNVEYAYSSWRNNASYDR